MKQREEAMEWWNSKSPVEAQILSVNYYKDQRNYKSLTGREIETIYNSQKEYNKIDVPSLSREEKISLIKKLANSL